MIWAIIGSVLGLLLLILIFIFIVGERSILFLSSTNQFFKESGWLRFLKLQSLHGYVYLRWTDHYIHLCTSVIAPIFKKRAVDWLADRYHGKVISHDAAKAIITIEKDIPLTDLEQVIPYPTARELLLQASPDILISECPCRSFRENPCQPTQVCMIIGQPFVDFKLEHSPDTSRLINKKEALQILEEEHLRGHIHSAWFRDVALDRFIAICNCCKCCCSGVEGMVKYHSRTMSSSGYVSQLNDDRCVICGLCKDVCAFEAISCNDEGPIINWEKCLGCGVCTTQCPNDALSLVRDERKGVPLDVRMMM